MVRVIAAAIGLTISTAAPIVICVLMTENSGVGGIKFYPLSNPDEEMPDYKVVSYGLERLKEKSESPFFLAIGLVKPHMPFSVPKKWFDLFPLGLDRAPAASRR